MFKVPKFTLYGENNAKIEESIQPSLALRSWGDLSVGEKQTALQEIINYGWLEEYSETCLVTIQYLNHEYLRQCPGKRLHALKPERNYRGYDNTSDRTKAAISDFREIFIHETSDALVLRMLSKFIESHVNYRYLRIAREAKTESEKEEYVASAFSDFDPLATCLNHVFEQFAVNQVVTRNGFIPRQDTRITNDIYVPTLEALSDPKWSSVNADLANMFQDYRDENYSEVITKAHCAVQRFLQVLVGEEGKNSKGELKSLFAEARSKGIISTDNFVGPIVSAISGFIPNERATNSTAKPAVRETKPKDALLMMNVVMVLLQHCLQSQK